MSAQPNPLWQVEEMIAAMDARPFGTMPREITGISIDTRTVKPGEAFFAIKGETNDGHDFVNQAMKSGAAVAIVAEARLVMFGALRMPLLVVADVLVAMEKLGMAARNRCHGRIIAVTGSAGKTTTKEMLRTVLSPFGKVHASAASFNNHWGVPLTLARMPADADFGVFEIGMNHAGEITPLVAMVRPNVAIITTIAPAHLGSFASLDDIARAKGEIFSGLAEGGTAVVNRDVKQFALLKKMAAAAGVEHLKGFGAKKGAEFRLESLEQNAGGSRVCAVFDGKKLEYELPVAGEHQAVNSLAVVGAAMLCGVDLQAAAAALKNVVAEAGRGRRHTLVLAEGSALLVDESYNANPGSMEAALRVLGDIKAKGRRIAVLGDMLELGQTSAKLHKALGKPIADANLDLVFLVGKDMAALAPELPPEKLAGHLPDATGLADQLAATLKDGDVIMLKASKGTRFPGVVQTLIEAHSAREAAAQ